MVTLDEITKRKSLKRNIIISIICIIAIIVSGIIMFAGSIDIKYDENYFSIESIFWKNLTINYSEIDRIEYSDNVSIGKRTYGFENTHLLMGNFKNEEFGKYIRYSNKGCETYVVLYLKDKTLVINGGDSENTKKIYNELIEKINKNN